jgi:hypothetical protein
MYILYQIYLRILLYLSNYLFNDIIYKTALYIQTNDTKNVHLNDIFIAKWHFLAENSNVDLKMFLALFGQSVG